MAQSRGLLVISDPSLGKRQFDTFTCTHCNSIKAIDVGRSASDMGGWCYQCAKAICPGCAGKPECTPFMKKIEKMEAEAYHRAQNERCLI